MTYGIKNCHFATVGTDGSYSVPTPLKWAVRITEDNSFSKGTVRFAFIDYNCCTYNQKTEISLEIYSKCTIPSDIYFALLCETNTDNGIERIIFPYCMVTGINRETSTEQESIDVNPETVRITALSSLTGKPVKITVGEDDSRFKNWFSEVQI